MSDSETGVSLQERVFAEVISGNITNEEDVIGVALAQYEERSNKKGLSTHQQKYIAEDNSLSITQIINTDIDENGHVLENLVTTNLIVLDKNQNLVNATSIETGSGQLSEYSIYATMNVSVTNDTSASKVRLNWYDTTLFYGTALKAGSLIQTSSYAPEPFFQFDDITKQISNPRGNVAYRYTPTNTEMITYMTLGCGRVCKSTINAGARSFILAYSVTTSDPLGAWESQYN